MEELGLMEQSPVLHLDEWEIPRENIVLNRKLGEGAFGAVCGGEVIGLRGEGEWVPVAVKSLKIGSLPEDKVWWLILPAPTATNLKVLLTTTIRFEIDGESIEIHQLSLARWYYLDVASDY